MKYELKKKYQFENGHVFKAEDGASYKIIGNLGRGGQGEVYKVIGNDGEYAVKWYFADKLHHINSAQFKDNLKSNISRGVPTLSSGDAATQFIWPMKYIIDEQNSFGYLMNIFPKGFAGLLDSH